MIENLNLKLSGELPVNREELIELISSWGRIEGFNVNELYIEKCEPKECYNLSNLDVSKIDNLSYVFRDSYYNGDLSNWNISNANDLQIMFAYSEFNNDSLKNWNTSNVVQMKSMFLCSKFNGDVSNWNVNKVINMCYLFDSSHFDRDISSWQFNKNIDCDDIFNNNKEFANKYNNGNNITNSTNNFLKWFEKNREKMKELNQGTREEILNFFSFVDNNLKMN